VSRLAPLSVMTDVDRDSELALVGRLRAGDRDAFDEVHREFHPHLFNFLARLARRRDVAEDLLEDTWLRVVVHARQIRVDTRLGPWLFTVARNLYLSYCRSRLLETGHALEPIGLWPQAGERPSPFEEAAANETERRIEAALASLPASYREVLLLVGVEGLSPIDAAAVCGVTPETLRQRLHRARVLLARRLEPASAADGTAVTEVLT
jgi:RNA polymerase sigma-70 factor (ECF subfamily)